MHLEKYRNFKIVFIYYLFLIIFLSIWIPFGIDLTDEGKQLSISWFMFQDKTTHFYTQYKIGSWLINGLWLNIIGKPFLLWERMGGVILMSLMTIIAYLILKKYMDDKYTFFIIFVTLFFVICENHPETKIDHSNLPTLLVIISLFFMILYIGKDCNLKGNFIFNSIAGLIMSFSIFTRFPHILFLFLPVTYFFILFKNNDISKRKLIESILSYYIPIFILIIMGSLTASISGNFGNDDLFKIINAIKGMFFSLKDIVKIQSIFILDNEALRNSSYNLFLLKKYIKDFSYILILAIIFLIGLFFGGKIYKLLNTKKNYSKKIDITVFIISGIALFIFMRLKPWMWYMSTFGFIMAYLSIIIYKRIDLKKEFFYLFWGISLIMISFLGSNNSFRHSVPAGAVFLLVPIIALINYNKKEFLVKLNLNFLYKFTLMFFIVLLFISGYKKIFDDNKRDAQPIFTRNSMFKSPELFGIFSTRDRVAAIDGIMYISKEKITNNDTLICFNSVPILHYLLNRDYFLKDPWTEQSNLAKELEKKIEKNIFPDYIIFSKRSAREKDWPDTNVLYEPADKIKYHFMIDFIDKYDYKNIYENNGFILYKK